jgi:hypothetical protein
MFVGKLAMFQRRFCVLLRLVVFADRMVMLSLMVVMRGGMVVGGRLVVMLTRRMFRCLCHLDVLPFKRGWGKTDGPTFVEHDRSGKSRFRLTTVLHTSYDAFATG